MCAKRQTRQDRVSLSSLAIEPCEGGYRIVLGDEPLLTVAGDPVMHEREDVLHHMIQEVDATGTIRVADLRYVYPSAFSALVIYGVQKEVVESNRECLSLHFDKCLRGDGIFYETPGPNEGMAQRSRWDPVYAWMRELGMKLPSLIQYWGDHIKNPEEDDEFRNNRDAYVPPLAFVESIENIYKSLASEQRAAVYALHAAHNVVLFPMLLALRKCSANEYASGVMAVHRVVAEDWAALSVPDTEHSESFQHYREMARVATEWLDLFPTTPAESLQAEIANGESTKREFKSSLRWHIHKKSYDEIITHACLKTIAAFLNTEGGVLLIGVEDSGQICGIEHDGFPSDDKFLLHFYNYLQECLGNQHATRIKPELVSVQGKKVCRVECKPFDGEWAYLRRKGEEEFLVRIGPRSTALKPSEIEKHMASRKSS